MRIACFPVRHPRRDGSGNASNDSTPGKSLSARPIVPWIAPHNPLATDAMHALTPPSAAHWCGTDAVGRDILSRIIAATRLALGIAFAAVVLSFAIGALAGLAAG